MAFILVHQLSDATGVEAGTGFAEPERAVRRDRDALRAKTGDRRGELADDSAGRDAADLIETRLGKPQRAVLSDGDPRRAGVRRESRKLARPRQQFRRD